MARTAAQRPMTKRSAQQRLPQRPGHPPAPSASEAPAQGITLRDWCELAAGLAWWGGVAWIALAYVGVV